MADVIETNDLAEVPYLRFSIFLSKDGDKVRSLHTRKYGRITHLINSLEWDTAEVLVRYGNLGENGGTYHNADELKAALSAFVEKENVDYILGAPHA